MFLTFSYGGEIYAKQALLSLLSIRARLPQAEVAIYTDRPAFFAGYGFHVHSLSKIEIAAMRGPLHFKHRVKLGILLRAALENPIGTPLIYIDSDTYFRGGSEADLKDRALVMHNLDGIVGETFYPRLSRFLAEHKEEIDKTPHPGLAPGFKMYNAGLIGLAASLETIRFLHQAVAFTDWLCVRLPRQTDWLEQTAVSWIGETQFGVAVDPMGFDHYWNWNTEVAAVLGKKTPEELRVLSADAAQFDALLAEAKALQASYWHRLTTRRTKRWNRSIERRLTEWRAKKLIG